MIHNTRFYDARGWDLYMAQQGFVMLTVDSREATTGAFSLKTARSVTWVWKK